MAILTANELLRKLPGNPDADTATRLRQVCLAEITRRAPDAPDEIINEALIRGAAYLSEWAPGRGLIERASVDGISTKYRDVSRINWFLHSGAAQCLRSYIVHRIMAI